MSNPVDAPEHTAERVALWRAMHLLVDAAPPVLADDVGLRIVAPAAGWRERGDMHPDGTAGFRAWVVARARFVEELAVEQAGRGVTQYVVLGAGVDTFAQRRPETASRVRVFEVDQPEPQAWKRRRLDELGLADPEHLRLVPVDFEAGADWLDELCAAGFDPTRPAVVASTGVSMYLTREATAATLRRAAGLAPGSTLAMTFQVPIELVDAADRAGREVSERAAASSGTPFRSFYAPSEMVALARDAGFVDARHVAGRELARRWFDCRADGLRPSSGEDLLVATT